MYYVNLALQGVKQMRKINCVWTLILSVALLLTACSPKTETGATPVETTATLTMSQYQLTYLLLAAYPEYFWCDPDFYPVAREGAEQTNAAARFASIQANPSEFAAILEQLKINAKAEYTDSEKLMIYREHKKLNRIVTLTSSGEGYIFVLRISQNQGKTVQGTISPDGIIKVVKEETSFNTCPICLSETTLIDTPQGGIPVERLPVGQWVWTEDRAGKRTAAQVIQISQTKVPPSFQILQVTLNDGRSVKTSAGHPSAEMKALGDYQIGETLDKGQIVSAILMDYHGRATFDILPGGETGFYWANGIKVMSTLKVP